MFDALKSLFKAGEPAKPAFGRLDARQAGAMHGKAGVLFVDVREPQEFSQGHIKGARLIPLSTVLAKADELAGHGEVVMVCRSGNRSGVACRQLAAAGLTNLHNLEGGMVAWAQAGLKIDR